MSPDQRILIINPNSNEEMTESLRKHLHNHWKQSIVSFFTAPSGPASINNDEDGRESMIHCAAEFTRSEAPLAQNDAFIVACYSQHPLVEWLQDHPIVKTSGKKVIGIFQASVLSCVKTLGHNEKYGIVSTGRYWEENLTAKIAELDIPGAAKRFAGITTTGLTAKELHDLPPDQVKMKMKGATKKLLRQDGSTRAICLGCAGMTGLDETVRQACEEELGKGHGGEVRIVDGIIAAIDIFKTPHE